MSEQPSLDGARLELARRIVRLEFERLTGQVIAGIRALSPRCRQYDDNDACLENVWEEFKYQFQRDNSTYHDFYEESATQMCADAIVGLTPGLQKLLWLWTDEFEKQWLEQIEVTFDNWYSSALAESRYRAVRDIANNEELLFDPGDAESRTQHDEDSKWMREDFRDG